MELLCVHEIPVRLRFGGVRWLLPRAGFAAWTLVILGLLFLGGPVEDAHGTTSPVVALVGIGLIVAVACIPWGRLPDSATAVLALLGMVLLVPMQVRSFPTWDRDYALLILLPLTWLAVKHGRRALYAGLGCATVVFWAPVLTDQDHPLLVVTLACVYSGLAALVGLLVQALRNRTRAEAAVAALGHTDSLTGLPNRRAWDETLTQRLVEFGQRGRGACIAMLDVDGFKIYNDDWGHIAGDRLLIDAAAVWSTTIGADAYLARHGGDEFALLIPDATADDAETMITRLRAAMPPSTGLSAGLSVWRPGETAETALERADRALYTVKRNRRERGRTVIETPS
jgi:diguanylate cyclase (GGDEF)-like protein